MVVTEAEAFEILILHICCCITSILSVDSSSITADLEFSTADSDSTSHGHDSHAWCLSCSKRQIQSQSPFTIANLTESRSCKEYKLKQATCTHDEKLMVLMLLIRVNLARLF